MTTTMIHVPVNMSAFERWSEQRGIASRGRIDRNVALHHLVDECFGQSALKPFKLMSNGSGNGALYAYTDKTADDLSSMSQMIASPDILNILNVGNLGSKKVPTDWKEGQRLGFDVTTIPERRQRKTGRRTDAHLNTTLKPGSTVSAKEAYLDWLESRFGEAADLRRNVVTHRVRQVAMNLGGHDMIKKEVNFQGDLVIKDPELFSKMIANGIGRYKSYGYGMILLRGPNARKQNS